MKQQVENAVKTYPISTVNSTDNCGRINKSLHLAIQQDTNIKAEFVQGNVGTKSDTKPHYFIHIPKGEIDQNAYVIDGAIDQFIGIDKLFSQSAISQTKTVNDIIVFDKFNTTPFNYTITNRNP